MKHFTISNAWMEEKRRGWGNGYVCIPEDHPLFGEDHEMINMELGLYNLGGGLTYSGLSCNFNSPEKPEGNYWIVGFDTNHLGDNMDNCSKEKVEEITQEIKRKIEEYPKKEVKMKEELADKLVRFTLYNTNEKDITIDIESSSILHKLEILDMVSKQLPGRCELVEVSDDNFFLKLKNGAYSYSIIRF